MGNKKISYPYLKIRILEISMTPEKKIHLGLKSLKGMLSVDNNFNMAGVFPAKTFYGSVLIGSEIYLLREGDYSSQLFSGAGVRPGPVSYSEKGIKEIFDYVDGARYALGFIEDLPKEKVKLAKLLVDRDVIKELKSAGSTEMVTVNSVLNSDLPIGEGIFDDGIIIRSKFYLKPYEDSNFENVFEGAVVIGGSVHYLDSDGVKKVDI
jgi:hypothetical protein